MIRLNPLVQEAVLGLGEPGRAHFVQLGHLGLQGLVLFLWWPPRNDLYHVLATGNPPDPLLAVVIAVGVTLAWYSLRAGAEEILLPGQHPLGEWALGSPLPLARILRGYLGAQLLQSLHAAYLSTPLLLAAFAVGGGTWPVLLSGIAAALVQALFYRLAGALLYLVLGHRRTLNLIALRAALILGYAVPPFVLPAASHIMVSLHLFSPSRPAEAATIPEPAALFVLIYSGLSAFLALVLYLVLARHRRAATAAGTVSAGTRTRV